MLAPGPIELEDAVAEAGGCCGGLGGSGQRPLPADLDFGAGRPPPDTVASAGNPRLAPRAEARERTRSCARRDATSCSLSESRSRSCPASTLQARKR